MNPLTAIYGGASALRNSLFDRGVMTAKWLDHPVVSVGNLSVGGAGKTPFVIALGELLKARGIAFDVLSRGYGRKTRGVLVVDPNRNPADFGDEPLLIARELKMPVVVGESRYEAGRVAEKLFQSQLHILDDGFQHRSLARDFDIVLLTELDFQDQLLPSGRLREPLSSLARADAIVLPTESEADRLLPPEVVRGKNLWRVKRQITVAGTSGVLVAFCGIARPEQFFQLVRASGVTLADEISFRDHHPYHQRDIEKLLAIRTKLGAAGFVTTEKDAINLGSLRADLQPLAIAKLTVTIDNADTVVDNVLERIRNRKPRS